MYCLLNIHGNPENILAKARQLVADHRRHKCLLHPVMIQIPCSLYRYHAQSPIHLSHLKDHAIFYHGFYATNVADVRCWIAVDENYVSQFAGSD